MKVLCPCKIDLHHLYATFFKLFFFQLNELATIGCVELFIWQHLIIALNNIQTLYLYFCLSLLSSSSFHHKF